MRLFLLLVACAIVAPAFASAQNPCTSNGTPAAGIIEITGGSASTTAYIDDRNYVSGNGIWIYLESNQVWTEKLPGVYLEGTSSHDLQRGGCPMLDFAMCEGDDICQDGSDWGSDSLVF